jgi:methylated-DNA-[protein]-cysteine S-methyltransferase
LTTGPTVVDRFRLRTPIGDLTGYARDGALCALDFGTRDWNGRVVLERRFGALEVRAGSGGDAKRALEAYFAGEIAALDEIAVDPGGTDFQAKVWAALRRIPAGRTVSYTDIARAVGAPHAVRAAGSANGQNPVPVVIPCHRVVRSDGTLGGYGGGLDRKRWLLDHEKARLAGPSAAASQRGLFPR